MLKTIDLTLQVWSISLLFAGLVVLPLANLYLFHFGYVDPFIPSTLEIVLIEGLILVVMAGIWASLPILAAVLTCALLRPALFINHPIRMAVAAAILVACITAFGIVPLDDPLNASLTVSQRFYNGIFSLLPWVFAISTFAGVFFLCINLKNKNR